MLAAPDPVADEFWVEQDTAGVSLDVLANDTDPDGDTLTVSGVGSPGYGSAEVDLADPYGSSRDQVDFTPGGGFVGDETFTYQVSDGGETASATISVHVHEGDDTLATARSVPAGPGEVEVRGRIGDGAYCEVTDAYGYGYGSSDVDLFRVDLTAGDELRLDVDAQRHDDGTWQSSLDARLRLFDAYGTELATNDDATDPDTGEFLLDSALLFLATTDGTYYVGVAASDNTSYDPYSENSGWNSSSGTYRLSVEVVEGTPPSIVGLALVDDTDTPGDLVTGDARIAGTTTGVDGGGLVDFDIDGDGYGEGTITPAADGTFEFDPDAYGYGLAAGPATVHLRARDDDAYGLVDAWQSFDFTFQPPPVVPPTLSGLSLADDTDVDGDLVTSDPSITGVIGDPVGYSSLDLQFDYDGDGFADAYGYGSTGAFVYDPSGDIDFGPISVDVRVGGWDDQANSGGGGYVWSDWQRLDYEYAPPPNDPPVVSQIALFADTDTPGDLVTSDARVVGLAADPEGDSAFPSIEYDLDGDGYGDGNAYGAFTIDLRDELTTPGPVTLQVRAYEWDDNISSYLYGDWASFSFTFQPDVNLPPEIDSVGLLEDTDTAGDGITTEHVLVGTVSHDDGTASALRVEYDLDGDGYGDGYVHTKNSFGEFETDPRASLDTGPVTVFLRARDWDDGNGYLYGNWTSFDFEYAGTSNELPVLVTLRLSDGASESTSPIVEGVVTHADGDVLGLTVEYDLDGDGYGDGTLLTRSGANPGEGIFGVDLSDALPLGSVTVDFRVGEWDATVGDFGDEVFGDWTSLTFVHRTDETPTIRTFALVNAESVDGRLVAPSPSFTGTSDSPGDVDEVEIEFDNDGDGEVDGFADVDELGRFSFEAADLPFGTVTVAARATEWNGELSEYLTSDLIDIVPALDDVSIVDLEVRIDEGGPKLVGRVVGEGFLAGESVQLDLDDDGDFETTVFADTLGPSSTTSLVLRRARTSSPRASSGGTARSVRRGTRTCCPSPSPTGSTTTSRSRSSICTSPRSWDARTCWARCSR